MRGDVSPAVRRLSLLEVLVRVHTFLCAGVLTLAILASPAVAAAQGQPAGGGDDQTALVAAGLTFMDISSSTGVGAGLNVLWNTLQTTGSGRIGIVGDLSFNHFDGGTVSTIMGGGRYTFKTSGKVVPYGQFLVGFQHCCGDTDFDPAIGFGADVAWRPNLNFRGEVNFILGDPDATRFFLGVSLPVMKKR